MKKILTKKNSLYLFFLLFLSACSLNSDNQRRVAGEYIIFSGRDRVSSGFHLYISDLNDGYPKKLTWNPHNNKEPIVNSLENKVYFLSDRNGGQKIFSIDLNWVGGTIDWQADWIWESYPEGKEASQILNDTEWHGYHNISPSGLHLVSMQYPKGQYDIVFFDKFGQKKITLTDQIYDDLYPQFTKDGLNVIYQKKISRNDMEIYIVDIDGSLEKNLTNNRANDYISKGPSISRDNKNIVFTSDRFGKKDIFLMDINGNSQSNLTNSDYNDFSPVFSPVKNQIAFVSDRDGNNDIFLMDIDNKKIKNISNLSSEESSPLFSPDGKYVAFVSDMNDILKIVCYNIQSSEITKIVNSPFLSGSSFNFYYAF